MELSPSESLSRSTVRIECKLKNGSISTGTGFFYNIKEYNDGRTLTFIITNKHVIGDATIGSFFITKIKNNLFNENSLLGETERITLDNFCSLWTPHPDKNIDLCAMPTGKIFNNNSNEDRPVYSVIKKNEIINEKEIAEMIGLENIIMVGYPNGLWDEKNNLPVFRKGIIATNYKYNWQNKKNFLIDAACFPGSSGSPIMLFDIGNYQTNQGTYFGSSRVKLLGILSETYLNIIKSSQKETSLAMPNNLGIAIKAEALIAFETLFVPENYE